MEDAERARGGHVFTLDRSTIPGCAPANGCGLNGLFSKSDTFPDWSPSQTEVVKEAITFGQNNVWRNNTYTGDWAFHDREARERGHLGGVAVGIVSTGPRQHLELTAIVRSEHEWVRLWSGTRAQPL
jgi:hypothetical protein